MPGRVGAPGLEPSFAHPGEHGTWNEEDWRWDPLAMTATALPPAAPPCGARARPATGATPGHGLADGTPSASGGSGGSGGSGSGGSGGSGSGQGGGTAPPPPAPRGSGSRSRTVGGASGPPVCQADGCGVDLSSHTFYHQRNKICTVHIKADVFLRGGDQLRFCQRCGHAHPLAEFDPGKHSCRKQLEKHNARRRKRQQEQAGSSAAAAAPPSTQAARGSKRNRSREGGVTEAAEGADPSVPGGSLRRGRSTALPGDSNASALFEQAEAAAVAAAAATTAAQPTHSGQAATSGLDSSASGSAAATALPTGRSRLVAPAPAGLAALGHARPDSPLLPLLDFDLDLDLKPTAFEDLFDGQQQQQPGVRGGGGFGGSAPSQCQQACDGELADDLEVWLNKNLAEDDMAQQVQQAQQAGWPTVAAPPPPPPAAWQALQPCAASLQLAQGVLQHELLPLDPLAPFRQQRPPAVPASQAPVLGMPVMLQPTVLQQVAGPLRPPLAQLPAAAGTGTPTLTTVSVKLFGCTPAELPTGLREHLRGWFEGAVHSLEGYLRPGCVHLSVQALLSDYAAAQLGHAGSQLQAPPEQQQPEQQQPGCCKPSADAGEQAPPAAAPAAPPAAPAGCCGRKRVAEAPAVPAGLPGSAVRRVVERMLSSGVALWQSKTMLVQTGGHVALVHRGRLRQTWDIEGAPSGRAVPALLDVSPPLLLASQPTQLRVSGLNMLQNDCQLLLRLQGSYVQPAWAMCGDCGCQASVHPGSSAATASQADAAATCATFEQRCCGCCTNKLQLVGLVPRPTPGPASAEAAGASGPQPASCSSRRLSAGAARTQCVRLQLAARQPGKQGEAALLPGLLHLDIQRRAFTAPRGARVLVVSSPAVHAELLALADSGGLPLPLLDQLGLVHEWLGRPEKLQYQLVESVAARLLFWAVGSGLVATAGLLMSVLQAQSGSSSAAAAGILQRALEAAGGHAAAGALSRLDGLAQLHLSMQAASAAALQRAAELACDDGLSLLHRAVQSGSAAMLQAVLGWGEDAGSPWRCDLAGPMGVTPLHLAALLPDAAASRQAVQLLVSRCAPGATAWDSCLTADGQSAADFFAAAAAARGASAAPARAQAAAPALGVPVPAVVLAAAPAAATMPPPAAIAVKTEAAEQQQQQQQQRQQRQQLAAGTTTKDQSKAPAAAARASAPADPAEMQPSTPRKNPGCLCAPGCPCALLDRCACCGSDDEEGEQEEGRGGATCGAGSGKCCCCSGGPGLPGCAGCEAPAGSAPAAAGAHAAGGACCGGGAAPLAAPAAAAANNSSELPVPVIISLPVF